MSVTTDSRIGTELAGYRIESLLGRGGMSVVYLAEDLALGRKVALKLLSPELSKDEDFRERFRLEWRRAASIDHPNVIPIYEAGEAGGVLFIAMRYVEGTDLKAQIRELGSLEPGRATEIIVQVAAGLDAAHKRGLVHRDMKPSNVLISSDDDHVYLADFGLTKPASSETAARESIALSGSYDYVSPEQITDGTAQPASDIYGLGAVLYEALTGRVPFPHERELQTLFAHLNDAPPRPSEVRPELPAAIDEVIAKAMAKEPELRYGSGLEFAQATAAAFPGQDRSRRRLYSLLIALIVIAAAAAVAIVLSLDSGDRAPAAVPVVTTDTLHRIDPETGRISASIELDAPVDDIAAGGAGIWLLDRIHGALSLLDPDTNAIAGWVALPDTRGSPSTVDVGERRVAVRFSPGARVELEGGAIWVYDPVDPSFTGVLAPAASPYGPLALGDDGEIWLVEFLGRDGLDRITRLSVDTSRTRAQIELQTENIAEASAIAITVGEQYGWVLASGAWPIGGPDETVALWQLDRETNEVIGATPIPMEIPPTPRNIGLDGNLVWIPSPADNKLFRFDSSTGQVASVIVGRRPVAVAAAGGSVWVASRRDGTVTRVDPQTLDIQTIPVGGTPIDLAAGDDAIWVAVRP